MTSNPPRKTRAAKLHPDRYAKVAAANGWDTNAAAAAAMGISEAQVSRVLTGRADPGLQFVLGLLDTVEEAGFRRMFTIVRTDGSTKE